VYLGDFHDRRAGITEEVLSVATDERGATPYRWLTAALPAPGAGMAVDLACGSGPVMAADPGRGWVGVDRSAGELAAARGRGVLVRADGRALPLRTGSLDVVACSMALMLFEPPAPVAAEVSRVLCPGGTAVWLLPGSRPLRASDRFRYLRLLAALRRARPAYPNTTHLAGLRVLMAGNALEVVADERRAFRYPLPDPAAAGRLVASLYLPGASPARLRAAEGVAAGWVGTSIGVPLRRVVCRRR
jgi:SAM-dependent methyltransferase